MRSARLKTAGRSPQLVRLAAMIGASWLLALGIASQAEAQASDPVGLDSLHRASVSAAAPAVRFDRVIVKLAPETGRQAHRALREGFAAGTSDPRAAALDALLEQCNARRLRRVFRSFEDSAGRQIDSASARVARLRERRSRRNPGFRLRHPKPTKIPDLENFFVVDVPALADEPALEALLAELRGSELVIAAQPDYVYRINVEPLPDVSLVASDPYVSADGVNWSAGSFGKDFPDLFGLRNLAVFEAWSLFDTNQNGTIDGDETGPGEGILVAVIDTGLDLDHPDIAGNVWNNAGEIPGNGIDDDGNGFVDDIVGWDFSNGDADPADGSGHGTHVSGTIAALANDQGIVGIAPYAQIMVLKGLSDQGSGGSTTLAPAIEYAAAHLAAITSNSWGGIVVDPLIEAAFETAMASGVLNIAAAGNDGSARLIMPALFPGVMAVAAVDSDDKRASFSNFGVGIDVAAPGRHVLSLSANEHDNVIAEDLTRRVGDRYMVISGTSMATPHASGAAAVLMSRFPTDTAAEIRGRMLAGAANVDAVNPGFEGALGAGRVDLAASIEATPRPLIQIANVRTERKLAGRSLLDLDVTNLWAAAGDVTLTLTSESPFVQIRKQVASLGGLGLGETKSTSFAMRVSGLELGAAIELRLAIDDGEGGTQELPLRVHTPFFNDVTEGSGWVPSGLLSYGVNFADWNHDGASDFAVGEFSTRLRLFENQRDGTFSMRRLNSSKSRTPAFFDMDADGDRDIYPFASNDGAGNFTLLPIAGLPMSAEGAMFTPMDLDHDGDLDIVVSTTSLIDDHTTFVYQNNGSGVFTDVWDTVGVDRTDFGQNPLVLDYDGDGDSDLVMIVGKSGLPLLRLYRNDGGYLTDVSASAMPAKDFCPDFDGCTPGITLAAGDYDNDGDIDLFVAGGDFSGHQPCFLFRNEGDGTFIDVTAESGDLISTDFKAGRWGTSFFDLENDGDLDIFVSFDNVILGSPERALDPTNTVFRNRGDGTFEKVSDIVFPIATQLAAYNAALGDFDGDGGIDIIGAAGTIIVERGGLLRNVADRGSWIELELLATDSPTDGFGARIIAMADGRLHMREVHYSPMDISFVHFGLGAADVIDTLEVRWPSGLVQMLENVPVNHRRIVREMASDCPGDRDSDGDGVCNASDNCLYRANGPWDPQNQSDADADGFGDACDPDLDNDGLGTLFDVHIALASLGLAPGDPGYVSGADLDGDGSVTTKDLDRILGSHGMPPGPSGLACADPTGASAPCTAPGSGS